MEHYDLSERISYLIAREITHGLSADESAELHDWRNSNPQQAERLESALRGNNLQQSLKELEEVEYKIKQDFISSGILKSSQASVYFFRKRKFLYAAAAVMLIAFVSGYTWFHNTNEAAKATAYAPKADLPVITPGKEGAILTLADGSTIVLDDMEHGTIATQGSTKVVLDNGRLAYNPLNTDTGSISYNTMTTPKGRQFHLVLPDGTNVWMNSASSIRFPTLFAGRERKVEVTGEVYFEVTADARKPFKVSINSETEIEVLGTSFNINAYPDENGVYTTLLQGSVAVHAGQQKRLLTPGSQARINQGAGITINNGVDLGKIMAWKNGLFNFQDASLAELMRQLARWYDIDVVYETNVPAIEFWGKMGRDLPLADVLAFLQKSDVHFRVEGRRVIVTK